MVEPKDGLVAPDGDPRRPATKSAPTVAKPTTPNVGLLL
jgi:hypothetical protein